MCAKHGSRAVCVLPKVQAAVRWLGAYMHVSEPRQHMARSDLHLRVCTLACRAALSTSIEIPNQCASQPVCRHWCPANTTTCGTYCVPGNDPWMCLNFGGAIWQVTPPAWPAARTACRTARPTAPDCMQTWNCAQGCDAKYPDGYPPSPSPPPAVSLGEAPSTVKPARIIVPSVLYSLYTSLPLPRSRPSPLPGRL